MVRSREAAPAFIFPGIPRALVGASSSLFAAAAREFRPKLVVEVVKRSDTAQGFEVLPQRWIVERTFGWLMRHRRLVRDYERTEASAVAWVSVAMIRIMLRRLA